MIKIMSLGPENFVPDFSESMDSFGCVFLVAQDGFIFGADILDPEPAQVAGRSYSGGGSFYMLSLKTHTTHLNAS
jgi:hypothetical protein